MSVRPFRHPAEIRKRDNTVLSTVRADYWRSRDSISTPAGQQYIYNGVCTTEDDAPASVVGHQNRRLHIAGRVFQITDAVEHDALDYLQLSLVEVTSDG